jgi:hypothetical protein
MLYLKRNTSYVLILWLLLVIISSYKLGFLGAMSTVYGFMLLGLVLVLSILSVLALLFLAYVYIRGF